MEIAVCMSESMVSECSDCNVTGMVFTDIECCGSTSSPMGLKLILVVYVITNPCVSSLTVPAAVYPAVLLPADARSG